MTRSCSALGCTARDNGRSRERGISFHQFPVDAAQRREWIRAVNRVDPQSRQAWRPGPGAILCSRHFAEADFERYGLRRKLRRGAVMVSLMSVSKQHPHTATVFTQNCGMTLDRKKCVGVLASTTW
uniref:THAP domain-containing protein 1 n=1 Tax=Amazona collaria TaxID=241587 RepID=A0A8B9FLH4_9PSIT